MRLSRFFVAPIQLPVRLLPHLKSNLDHSRCRAPPHDDRMYPAAEVQR